MIPASRSASSVISSGPLPLSVSIASMTSKLLPTAQPSGCPISVIAATVRLPASSPISTIRFASVSASCSFSINAPSPTLTSSTMASLPAASFLLMIEEAISPKLSTVAVTSRSAYSFLSAGVMCAVCPMTAMPILRTCARNASGSRLVRKPGMDSILSTVPPVKPSPRPLILAIGTPQAEASGATISVVLSPTPPVECLSTLIPGIDDRSTVSPEYRIASVSSKVSLRESPRKKIAIKSADA